MRRLALLALGLLAAACASAPISRAAQTDLARADALVLEGCYDCLRDAQAIYDRVAVGKARPLVVQRLFETSILLALREKELALNFGPSLDRARTLAAELPPALEPSRYLAIVGAVPPDSAGWPRKATEAFRREHSSIVPAIDDDLVWLRDAATLSLPVRQYLALSIHCAYPTRRHPAIGPQRAPAAGAVSQSAPVRRQEPDPAALARAIGLPEIAADAPPLVAYRAATCPVLSQPALERVLQAVPRFAEVNVLLARIALITVRQDGGLKARPLLADADQHFPQSPTVTWLNGNFNQIVGDARAALGFYDRTLALQPLHEDALLGRTVSLAYLKRFDEAAAAATHMIELQTDNVPDAYYWRAWIRHEQHDPLPARADIDEAKRRAYNANIYTLAGIIEYEQDDLAQSQPDLAIAKRAAADNCPAMWYLSLVDLKRERWLGAAGNFNEAMDCYEHLAINDESAMRAMRARDDIDPTFKANQIAGFETAAREDRSQQYAAAFNAANQFAHSGNFDRAKVLVEVAAKDPALADRVKALREILKDKA